ncbi:MAG: Tat pathway signal sequence domain protein [Pseudomonadota bacterium]
MKKLLGASVLLASTTALANGETVRVELNKLEPAGTACQAYIVIENSTEAAFDKLALDLVMFDPDGVIATRLAVEMGPLRAGRTSVKVFGIDAIPCDGLSRILVNDVLACESNGAARGDCLDLIETASRGSVELIN